MRVPDRREFLSTATPAVLGFPFLGSLTAADQKAAPAPTAAELLAQVRERMRQEHKAGVILIIPADQPSQQRMSFGLIGLLGVPARGHELARKGVVRFKGIVPLPPMGPGDTAAQHLFCQAVFVCLPVEDVAHLVPDLKPDDRAILLTPDGKLADRLQGDLSLYEKDFAPRMGRLVHGERGERLASAVAAQRRALGEETARQCDADLRALDANRFATRQAAHDRLSRLASRISALLEMVLRGNPSLEVRRRVERLFEEVYFRAPDEAAGPRLPYGVEWKEQHIDSCPFCGQGFAPAPSRLFLHFTTKKK